MSAERFPDVRVIDAPGFYRIAARDYHADPCIVPSLSSGVAETIVMKSPLHGWHAHPRLNPEFRSEERTEFDIGSAAHALLLEGEDRMTVIPFADYRKQEARDLRDAARAEGKHPVLAHRYNDVQLMRDAARRALQTCPDLAGYSIDVGNAEHTLVWREGETTWLRARPDWYSPRTAAASNPLLFLDYKSTANACPSWFTTQLVRMGYAFQQAFYRRGAREIFGVDPRFVFMAQDVEAPYQCSFHAVAPSLDEIAERQVERAIRTWAECVAAGKWPSYENHIHYAEATSWQLAQHEAELQDDEVRRGSFADPAILFEKPPAP